MKKAGRIFVVVLSAALLASMVLVTFAGGKFSRLETAFAAEKEQLYRAQRFARMIVEHAPQRTGHEKAVETRKSTGQEIPSQKPGQKHGR